MLFEWEKELMTHLLLAVRKESGVLSEKALDAKGTGIWQRCVGNEVYKYSQAGKSDMFWRPKRTVIQFSSLSIEGLSSIASKVCYGCGWKEAKGQSGPLRLMWIAPLLVGPSWSGHWQVTDEISTFAFFSVPDTQGTGELRVCLSYL